MKKGVILAIVLLLAGCVPVKEERQGHSNMIMRAGDEIVSVYSDGEDVTDEVKALEAQTEEAISRFLNRDRGGLEFDVFCMLEEDGMTVEVIIDEVSYTFTCSMQGDIICVGRTDGKLFDLRGK